MKLLTLTNLLGAAKLARAAPSADLASLGMFHQNGIDIFDQPSSVLASSTQQWKVGDPCVEGGSPGTCVLEDLGGFFKPACPNDISFFGCGSRQDVATWGQAVNSMRCCVQRRCEPPWDKYFCKNTYKTIMPAGFHPDPNLCKVGSDVLCWIESVSEDDPSPSGMTASGYETSALDIGDPENGLMALGVGIEDPSNDSWSLSSGTGGLLEGKVNGFAPGGSLEGISALEDFSSAPGNGSPDYSMFSR